MVSYILYALEYRNTVAISTTFSYLKNCRKKDKIQDDTLMNRVAYELRYFQDNAISKDIKWYGWILDTLRISTSPDDTAMHLPVYK